jgi:hypothetical protein
MVDDLRDSNEHRREHAAIWVWSRGPARFSGEERARLAEALTPLATDAQHPVTSAQAVAALVVLDPDGAVELALTALHHPHTEVRHIVAAQLPPTGDRRVVDALVALLDDADGFVREAAAIGLQSQGDRAALEPYAPCCGENARTGPPRLLPGGPFERWRRPRTRDEAVPQRVLNGSSPRYLPGSRRRAECQWRRTAVVALLRLGVRANFRSGL